MFGLNDLKPSIKITDATVECCVKDCPAIVPRRKNCSKELNLFKCSRHGIIISPSTFEYQNELDNLLWVDESNLRLLSAIKTVKRESRMTHDNSEDALTWNVFRFIEKQKLTSNVFLKVTGRPLSNAEMIYWSYSPRENGVWAWLKAAREEFELRPEKGSEPDIIISSDNFLIFIEAKLTANNNTVPKLNCDLIKEKYLKGGRNWFSQVFNLDFETVAISYRKYELLRLWLIGSWIAAQQHLDFYLLNLVRDSEEKEIEKTFKALIKENSSRQFRRFSWEDIYQHILSYAPRSDEKARLSKYFENKTLGYDRYGNIRKAFTAT